PGDRPVRGEGRLLRAGRRHPAPELDSGGAHRRAVSLRPPAAGEPAVAERVRAAADARGDGAAERELRVQARLRAVDVQRHSVPDHARRARLAGGGHMIALLALALAAAPASRLTYESKCLYCHSADVTEGPRLTDAGWRQIIERMRRKAPLLIHKSDVPRL